MTKQKFRNLCKNFSVNKHSKIFAIVPFVILLIALIVIVAIGAPSGNFSDAVGIGIDFEGGTILEVTLGQEALDNYEINRANIKRTIESVTDDNGRSVVVSVEQLQKARAVEKTSISFRYKNVSDDDKEITALNEKILTAVKELYSNKYSVDYQSIGATAARDLLSKAGIALAVSVVLILIYIIIRFTLMSGFAAIIALIHDVVIMFALTVICRVQINSSYVAAMITIIAYSINNTIIIFDRCRESLKPLKGQKNIDYAGIGDMAVRSTFTRSVYTTFTTMITVIFLAILGSDSIREFCVPIILGLLAGMYSSVCLATPLWAAMSASFDKTRAKYSKRHAVTYEKADDEEEIVYTNKNTGSSAPVAAGGIKPVQKQPQRPIYKYKKKNTTFKKK
ncbi:MAG: protein translocase subunit SecF [Bacteroides sp.]|nr:protein translocase subunit SecF [Bacillota bacterium]MCM1394063.1 protein translocase subunit SecF [[Eubacterium] siraeum]MCM1455582.1 protein translocase subunit SecF [Bacteroides sp.]